MTCCVRTSPGRLEVSLEKQSGGVAWPSLSSEPQQGLPLQGPVTEHLTAQQLTELGRKLAQGSGEEVSAVCSPYKDKSVLLLVVMCMRITIL